MQKEKLSRHRSVQLNVLLLTLLLVCGLIFLVQAAIWAVRTGYLFAIPLFRDVREVAFADFFHVNHIVWENSPYFGDRSSYPPLVLLLCRIFTLFTDYSGGYEHVLETQPSAALSLIVFYLVFVVLFCLTVCALLRKYGLGTPVKIAAIAACLLTTGMIYELERGNCILYALLGSLAFLTWYDSESPLKRELALLALAAAVAVKLYPALFAVLLLRRRDIAALGRCACESVLLLVLPFLFFDRGLDNLPRFLHWLTDFSGTVEYGYNYSLSALFAILRDVFDRPVSDGMLPVARYAVLLLGGIFSLTAQKRYQALLCVTLVMLLFPSPSYTYTGIFLIVPILAFFCEREKSLRDLPYVFLLTAMVAPVYLGAVEPALSLYTHQLVQMTAMLLGLVWTGADGILYRLSRLFHPTEAANGLQQPEIPH